MASTSRTDDRAAAATLQRVGRHYLCELHGCRRSAIARVAAVEGPFLDAVAASGAQILSHASHQFVPHGATILALLSESHASIHTWPELGYAAVDVFTCSDSMEPGRTVAALAAALGATSSRVRVIDRGTFS